MPLSTSADTAYETQVILVARWRVMTIADRAALVRQMCDDVDRLARAGIVADEPGLSDAEINRELLRRRYGQRVADDVNGDRARAE
jgi:hypothetical protein